ncbi:hypothetical protein Q3G72_019647 [Acer saccharum]|nr:hypothetical protein Q3G72_019647 [Acer saccharum]
MSKLPALEALNLPIALSMATPLMRCGLCAGPQAPDQRSSPAQIAQWSAAGRALVHTSASPPVLIAQWCSASRAPV